MTQTTPQTPDPAVSPSVPGDLAWNLGMVLRGFQSAFEEAVEGMPAGIRGFQVLSAVVHRDLPNQQALGAHLGIDRTVLTYLLDTLVKAGVVERIPDPSDRRARPVVPTNGGRELLAALEARVEEAEAQLLSAVTPEETSALRSITQRLAEAAHSGQPGSNPCTAMDHLLG